MKTYKIITLGLVGITACSGAILSSLGTYADNDSATDTTTVTIPVSCMMSGTVDAPHSAELVPGTYSGATGSVYENGIGKTTLTTYCNDYNGFSLYAIGFTGDSYDSENHTKLVGTSASGNTVIPTGVYTTGDTTSSWSMKVTKVTDSTASYNPNNMSITNSFDTWHVVPNAYTQVAQYKASTGSSATDSGTNALGAKVETTYAAYIAPTQAADTYTGQVKYVMVHPYSEEPVFPDRPGYITYRKGTSDAVGTMDVQTTDDNGDPLVDNASVTLYASNFSRAGYGFAGWSDVSDYTTNPNAHFYGPMETITAPTGTTANGLSLYAVWIESEGDLQDTSKTASVCSGLTAAPANGTANLSSVSALTDQRDNQAYAIAKLADGNCWMIENLRLENTGTNNSSGSLAQGYDSSFIGLATPESANFENSTVANSLYSIDGSTTATISGDYQGSRFPRYNNANTQSRSTSTTTFQSIYSYGNYYTWHAAIADTTYHTSGDYSTTSICPKGWRLPLGNQSVASKSFGALSVALGGPAGGAMAYTGSNPTGAVMSTRFRSYPNNFLYSGSFANSSTSGRGDYGTYWSSTAGTGTDSYGLVLSKQGYVLPGTNGIGRNGGYSIRCIVANS